VGKLVRDRIPDIMRADGREPETRILAGPEYLDSLFHKLLEEADELRAAPVESQVEEAADVYEVLLSIANTIGSSIDELQETAERKRAERGGFEARVWLERW
jgi:predicted house-cleaning noncanonical NTP pyrophosphatase (MazG superfamily)